MSISDATTPGGRGSEADALIERYGSHGSAVTQTLVTWLNLSLLLALGWPAMVVVFGAPYRGVEHLPLGWFLVRLGIAAIVAGLTVVLWRLGPVSTRSGTLAAMAGIVERGRLWRQLTLTLLGVSITLVVLLILAEPARATRLVLYGVVESFAIQALLCGFMKRAFDVLLTPRRSNLLVTGLFAAFFGAQNLALASASPNIDENLVLVLLAAIMLGAVIGALSLLLRNRTGTILPGFLLHLLFLHLLILFFE